MLTRSTPFPSRFLAALISSLTAFQPPRASTCLLVCLLAMASGSLRATTVLELSFNEVAQDAELVFEGRVQRVEARQSGQAIHTYVTFEVLDVIKGSYPDATIELSFLGGRVNGRELRVTDMNLPSPGETGFYFVESLGSNLVHPFVGWDQGRFLIEKGPQGNKRVTSADHAPVQRVDQEVQAVDPGKSKSFSKGVAKGVITQGMSLLSEAMTVDEFREAVREAAVARKHQEQGR